jgi:hypothetical protein
MPLYLMNILSFLSGYGLGVINYRMFVRSVEEAFSQGENGGIRKQVVTAGIFRHLFIFLAGILLIRGASFAPFPLCGGILLATYVCRYRTWREQQSEENNNS